jgi:hypothetical protein
MARMCGKVTLAAMTAAAYVKNLLLRIFVESVTPRIRFLKVYIQHLVSKCTSLSLIYHVFSSSSTPRQKITTSLEMSTNPKTPASLGRYLRTEPGIGRLLNRILYTLSPQTPHDTKPQGKLFLSGVSRSFLCCNGQAERSHGLHIYLSQPIPRPCSNDTV